MKGGFKRCEPSMTPGSIKWVTGDDKKFEDDMTDMPLDERNKENIKILIPSLKTGGTAETNMESCMSYFTALFDKMKNLIIRIDIVQIVSGPPPEPTTHRTVLQLIRPSWTPFFTGETVTKSSRDIPVHKEKKRSSYQEKQLQKMFDDLMRDAGSADTGKTVGEEKEEQELVAHKNIPEPKTFGEKLHVLSQLIGNLAAQEKNPIMIKLWLSKRAKLNELRDANMDPDFLKNYPSPPPWQDKIKMTQKELEKQKQETKVRGGSRRRKRKCSKRTRKKRGSGCAFSRQPGICQILFEKKGNVNSTRITQQHSSPIGYYKLPATILNLGNDLKGIDYSILVDSDNLCIKIGNECWIHCNNANIFPASVAQWLVLTYEALSDKDRKRYGWERGPPVLLYPRKLEQIKRWIKGIYTGPYI